MTSTPSCCALPRVRSERGRLPVTTSAAAPCSIAASCASSRSPSTTRHPGSMYSAIVSTCMAPTSTRSPNGRRPSTRTVPSSVRTRLSRWRDIWLTDRGSRSRKNSLAKSSVARMPHTLRSASTTGRERRWCSRTSNFESPRHSCLILTHILQTEMKSKVNAFKKRLQRKPAFPDRPPSRRTIMGTSQIATQACYLRPEGADGHRGRRVSRALGHHRQHQRLNYLVSRALWLRTRERPDLQQAHRQRGQQSQQTDQTINGLQLPLLNTTATFEALMIVLNQPAMLIPVDPLPRLFERGGGHRGQQDPFQRLLAFWSLLFPDANDPHGQGLLARSRLMAWGQERHLTKGNLELGRTSFVTMPGWNLERTARLARPGSGTIQSMRELFFALLDAPILGRSHQKVRLRRLTGLKEREHIRTPISDMHPHACRLRCPNALHLAYPDIGFARFPLAPLIPLFSLGSGNAHKGFLGHAPEHSSCLRMHCKHGLDKKTASSFVAN